MATDIRRACAADLPVIAELLLQLDYQQDLAALTNRLAAWDADASSTVLVSADEDAVTGLIAVHVCPFLEQDGSWARIVALVVAERARGRGLAGELLAAAEQFAGERGCVRIEVTSGRRRTDAHAYYRHYGYVDVSDLSGRFLRELEA